MAANNNNGMRNPGIGNPLSSPGAAPRSITMGNPTHFLSQSNPQTLGGSPFPAHFRPSNSQSTPQQHFTQTRSNVNFQPQPRPQSITHFQNLGNNNMGISSPGFTTPNTGNKRAAQKPPSRPPGSFGGGGATNSGSVMKTMELAPAAKRKKHNTDENKIPEEVAALLPESALYTQLLEFEARVDDALMKKKLSIQESITRPPTVQKTLRIYVFNTFANQEQAVAEANNESPSWSLKIIGRILEEGSASASSGLPYKTSSLYPKFSTFFKKITIYLDQTLYADNHVILWENARSPAPQDGFEVTRNGNKEFTAIIRIEMNYSPEKFKLSPALVELLGIEVETRQRVMAALWHYVKVRNLQIPSDPSLFMCDPPLKKIFGEDKMRFNMVSLKMSHHFTPPPPIHLEHRIKLYGDCPSGNSCYDVMVDVPLVLEKDISALLANFEKKEEIDACNEAISDAIKKIQEHRRRRAFFLGFSQSPADFINGLIASQSRDLKLVAGDGNHNAEREHRSEFYNQPWAEDAVVRYLNRKSTAGNDAPGST